MKHVFDELELGIEADLAAMKIAPDRGREFDAVCGKLVKFQRDGRYAAASRATGVPEIFIAASFEREASSNFTRSAAQGDPLNEISRHVPKGLGPYLGPDGWTRAAVDAYRLNGLDKVGAKNWTWALAYYFAELFNGFGYRDWHHMRSPYVVGGTTLQQRGKYEADGQFNASLMDPQLGVIPMMARMCELAPALTIAGDWPFPEPKASVVAPSIVPTSTPLASFDIKAIQRALNVKGLGPLLVDGSFGRKTSGALREFEAANGLKADGLMDQETVDRLLKS